MSQLRVFDICREGTHVLGPGCRYVIWTQGCDKHCRGCLTPESQNQDTGVSIDSIDLASDIILSNNIKGITISGGEPFLQVDALVDVIEYVKMYRPELTLIIYTGYSYDILKVDKKSRRLLNLADVLIDGPYIEEYNDGVGLRGSSNQRVIAITNRLAPYMEIMRSGKRKVQNIIESNGMVTRIGVPRNTK